MAVTVQHVAAFNAICMNKDLLQNILTSIQAYYERLGVAAAPTVMMFPDYRKYVSEKDDFYHDGDEDERSFYFYHELYQPLLKTLAVIWENVGLEIDPTTLPSDFRISTSEAVEILTSTFPIKRELVLASISCPLSDFNHLKPGILEANETELSQVKTDLSDHFKRLNLAGLLSDGLSDHTNDDVLTALYRVRKHRSAPTNMVTFEEMRRTAKEKVVEFWSEKDVYSTTEIQTIEGIIKSDIFKGFREDCAVEYNRRYGRRPDRPKKTAQTLPSAVGGDVLVGIDALRKHLHCGPNKAQDIVDSKILQKAGVAYRVGRTNQFDRKKLDAFLAANPTALANVPERKPKKRKC